MLHEVVYSTSQVRSENHLVNNSVFPSPTDSFKLSMFEKIYIYPWKLIQQSYLKIKRAFFKTSFPKSSSLLSMLYKKLKNVCCLFRTFFLSLHVFASEKKGKMVISRPIDHLGRIFWSTNECVNQKFNRSIIKLAIVLFLLPFDQIINIVTL